MSKISVDARVQRRGGARAKEDLVLKAFQVALTTLTLLDESHFEGKVEVIKITWSADQLGQRERPLDTDFHVVFTPLLWSLWQDEFQVVARWNIGHKTVSIYTYDEEKKRVGSSITGISLADESVNSLAKALIQAMRAIIQERKPFFSQASEKLTQADAQLVALLDKLNVKVRA
ncbi:hypothetical protein KKA69_00115 [Patescibacteria group bacterium]|nr:hypothetical protein [Patescibacteria group bacterium]